MKLAYYRNRAYIKCSYLRATAFFEQHKLASAVKYFLFFVPPRVFLNSLYNQETLSWCETEQWSVSSDYYVASAQAVGGLRPYLRFFQ